MPYAPTKMEATGIQYNTIQSTESVYSYKNLILLMGIYIDT
jgi:hypothetical protein